MGHISLEALEGGGDPSLPLTASTMVHSFACVRTMLITASIFMSPFLYVPNSPLLLLIRLSMVEFRAHLGNPE